LHHPAKGPRADGQAARGSGALTGLADVVMEMACYRRARSRDRLRRICAYSRYAQTPRHLIVELNADGTDYLVRTDAAGTPLVQPWPELHHLLAHASDKLTQQEILQRWPAEGDAPERSTLSRWLKRATEQGVVCCSGTGYRGDALRYWLPGREPLLWPGDSASEAEKQAWRDRCAEYRRTVRERPASLCLAVAAAEGRCGGPGAAGNLASSPLAGGRPTPKGPSVCRTRRALLQRGATWCVRTDASSVHVLARPWTQGARCCGRQEQTGQPFHAGFPGGCTAGSRSSAASAYRRKDSSDSPPTSRISSWVIVSSRCTKGRASSS
jgi:hypothetical protein